MTELKMRKNTSDTSDYYVKGLRCLANMFIHKWCYFVLSIVFTFSIAVIYLSVTPSFCMRSLPLSVKGNLKDETSSETLIKYFFNDMGLFKSKANIRNEISVVKSPILMKEVVRRLGLNVNYTVSNVFKDKVLYKTSPINILLGKADLYNSISFQIEMLSNNKYIISHVILNGKEKNCGNIEGNLAVAMQTCLGVLTVLPTHAFTEQYIGIPINYSKVDIQSVANRYSDALNVSLSDQEATVADILIKDASIGRAEDVLNTLAVVYDENRIKNKIAVSNAQLINSRRGKAFLVAPNNQVILFVALVIGLYLTIVILLLKARRVHRKLNDLEISIVEYD
jgi:tyrosine-protein kinase Etk/Wzc